MEPLLISLLIYIPLGIVAGFLSGLFGAGGGVVIVPGLVLLFHLQGIVAGSIMHIAVGTSLATMVPVALRSLMSHRKYNADYFEIYRRMVPALVIGVLAGSILAHFLHSRLLEIAFGVFVLFIAFSFLFEEHNQEDAKLHLPGRAGMSLAGGFIGLQSGLLGIGGSAFSVPFLSHRGVPIRVAVTVSVAIALTAATLGAVTFMVTGINAGGLPVDSIGYVN